MRIRIKHSILLLFISIIASFAYAQELHKRDLIQFSGIIVTGEDLSPIPFTHILIRNTHQGTMTDYHGYFSFVARESDTIIFSSMGYKRAKFIIPDTLSNHKYSLIQVLTSDTIYLSETVIRPWSNFKQFEEAFMKTRIPDDDMERAKKNLANLALRAEMDKMTPMASINYKNYMDQQVYNMGYKGMTPPSLTSALNNPLLNPFAWSQFIQAWKDGKFKRQPSQDIHPED